MLVPRHLLGVDYLTVDILYQSGYHLRLLRDNMPDECARKSCAVLALTSGIWAKPLDGGLSVHTRGYEQMTSESEAEAYAPWVTSLRYLPTL